MKQECKLFMVWFTWLGLPLLAFIIGFSRGWWAFALILFVGVFAQIFYVKHFPGLSKLLGYGSVDDVPVENNSSTKTSSDVTLYTANVCPFCPIVKKRLVELQKNIYFKLNEIDITFKPSVLKEKGFSSVPVIEISGEYWNGNATSSELFSFITKHSQKDA